MAATVNLVTGHEYPGRPSPKVGIGKSDFLGDVRLEDAFIGL
jgi:hypothetical protein